jgi:hypothetical protein
MKTLEYSGSHRKLKVQTGLMAVTYRVAYAGCWLSKEIRAPGLAKPKKSPKQYAPIMAGTRAENQFTG